MNDTTVTASPEDDESAPAKPDKQRNPVRRGDLYAKFVDGKWWTPAGMAAALGSDLANELAIRYYLYKLSTKLEGRATTEMIQVARKKCVQDVLSSIPATGAETKEEDDQVFYRLKAPMRMKVNKGVKPKAQVAPAETDTGLTTSGVLAAILELGGACDLDALVEKLRPAMVDDARMVVWAKKQKGHRGIDRNHGDMTIENIRRSAVTMMCERAKSNHTVKIVKIIRIEYTPPKAHTDDYTEKAT